MQKCTLTAENTSVGWEPLAWNLFKIRERDVLLLIVKIMEWSSHLKGILGGFTDLPSSPWTATADKEMLFNKTH